MSYKQGIVEAITDLKDRNGSSIIAIKKAMQGKLPKDKKWQNATFLLALKAGVTAGDFVQVKHSYKLSSDFKKKTITAAKLVIKKAAPKKPVVKKSITAKKSKAVKKSTTAIKKKKTPTKATKKVKTAAAVKKTTKSAKPAKKVSSKAKGAASTKAKAATKTKATPKKQ